MRSRFSDGAVKPRYFSVFDATGQAVVAVNVSKLD